MLTLEQQIDRAVRVHKSVEKSPRNSPVAFRAGTAIHFRTAFKPNRDAIENDFLLNQINSRSWMDDDLNLIQDASLVAPEEYREAWRQGGDHNLLEKILDNGFIPFGWNKSASAYTAPTLAKTWLLAKERGYFVPERYLAEQEKHFYGEDEAWCAAQYIVRGETGYGWPLAGRPDGGCVLQLTGSFIVPDINRPDKPPYILDQLWLAKDRGLNIRKIALEIDGEVHLNAASLERDRQRTEVLESMGYEVYRAAGWWARIDPYRVIYEFLDCSGLLPDALRRLPFNNARSLDDYYCRECGQPMCRWDTDWITTNNNGEPAHLCCVYKDC